MIEPTGFNLIEFSIVFLFFDNYIEPELKINEKN